MRCSTQQDFENILADGLHEIRECEHCVVEIENYFGDINVPRNIRDLMLRSPVLLLKRSKSSRIQHILKDYDRLECGSVQ